MQHQISFQVPPTSARTPLDRSLLRLLEIIDEENAILCENRIGAHDSFADRKNQALKELMAVQKFAPAAGSSSECPKLLNRLKLALGRNSGLLRFHIAAVSDISDIIIASMRESDSDGTYSRGAIPARR